MTKGESAPFARPVLAASLCLGESKVRYDGQAIRDAFFVRLLPHVDLKAVCPEVEIGLGVPRAPIQLQDGRLLQPSTGLDVTDRLRRFADAWLDGLGPVDGFLLKSRSPSCGVRDVKRFDGRSGQIRDKRGTGLFAEAAKARHPLAVMEDEGRLNNRAIREHFLVRLFASAALRRVKTVGRLADFHARHKLLLLASSERGMRALGRLTANREGLPAADLIARYAEGFAKALESPPRTTALLNVLQHAMGFFKEDVGARERAHFLKCLRDLKAGRTAAAVPTALLRGWLARHPKPFLEGQAFLNPFPEDLLDLSDSGHPGR